MLLEADLPDDVEALRALVLEQARELDVLKTFKAEVERLTESLAVDASRFRRDFDWTAPLSLDEALALPLDQALAPRDVTVR